MKFSKIVLTVLFVFIAMLVLNSCIGASADISIRANGSGRIALEYRFPMMLESLGRLDGNERWPAIPVGRADFERSLARIPGLRLRSFSSREVPAAQGGSDLLVKTTLDFSDTAALLAFLDTTGSHATFTHLADTYLLRLSLLDPSPQAISDDLVSLLKEVCEGYDLRISLIVPRNASIAMFPANVEGAKLVSHGKKVSFTIAMGEMLSLSEGLVLEMKW